MNNLENLVPPLDLCQQIPQGKFDDSALVLAQLFTGHMVVAPREAAVENAWDIIAPAPMLAEIMAALANHGSAFTRRDDDGWMVMLEIAGDDEGYGYDAKIERDTTNPATAAMKLWLEVCGKETKND